MPSFTLIASDIRQLGEIDNRGRLAEIVRSCEQVLDAMEIAFVRLEKLEIDLEHVNVLVDVAHVDQVFILSHSLGHDRM